MQEARGASLTGDPTTTRGSRHVVLFVSLGALGLAADQLTKLWAEQSLAGLAPQPFIGNLLQFYLTYNPGAAFSTGVRLTWVFSTIAIVATLVVLRFGLTARSRAWAIALGLLLGGVTGNLGDRLFRPPGPMRGHVVDFLMLPHWPIFNVADVLIDTAAVLIVILSWRGIRLDGTRETTDD